MAEANPKLPSENEVVTVEDLCLLANSFTEQAQYDKALQLYESACRLYPQNLALKINLGRVRSLKNQSFESPKDILAASEEEKKTSQEEWSNRYQGLGELFLRIGRKTEARRIFEISKVSAPNFYFPYMNLGKLYLEEGNPPLAIQELEHARRLNPFAEEIVELLADSYTVQREYKEALKYAVDGLILSGEITQKQSGKYQAKIKELMGKLSGFTPKMRNELVRERRARINSLYEELAGEIQNISSEVTPPATGQAIPGETKTLQSSPEDKIAIEEEEKKRIYDVAVLMKRHLIFRNMDDADILKLARFTSEMRVLQSDYVYQEGDPVYGLYFINRGKVEIQKATPFGPIVYATFEKTSFFGDDNLLSGRERYTSAVCVQESDLLFIDKAGLATIFARERSVAIHFLWYLWKSLSIQIRESNDRMISFFAIPSEQNKREIISKGARSAGQPTHIEIDRKLEVLQAKGLSTKELGHIARLSNEEVYNPGETIFHEGDIGDRLYIVLDGAVMISKRIAGVGEESLAVLKKGDFFGEMALVGQHHYRSANATAHEQKTTLLVISRDALREILSIDTNSAYQFLTILCRILSQRLLEMNEKIYQWRLMSGSFH